MGILWYSVCSVWMICGQYADMLYVFCGCSFCGFYISILFICCWYCILCLFYLYMSNIYLRYFENILFNYYIIIIDTRYIYISLFRSNINIITKYYNIYYIILIILKNTICMKSAVAIATALIS